MCEKYAENNYQLYITERQKYGGIISADDFVKYITTKYSQFVNSDDYDFNAAKDVCLADAIKSIFNNKQQGGAPSKVVLFNKSYTVYVKVNGEFMTVKQATKTLKPQPKPKTKAPSKRKYSAK